MITDLQYLGFWFSNLFGTIPEKPLLRALKKLPKARKSQAGSMAVAAFYRYRLTGETGVFLQDADEFDQLLFGLAKEAGGFW